MGPSVHRHVLKAAPLAILIPVMILGVVRAQDSVSGGSPVFTAKQKPPANTADDNPRQAPNIRVQSPIVAAPITVIDSAGEFVYDLEQKDFRILDNGVQQRIERFEPAVQEPIAAAIVIQTSDSVGPLLEQVKPLGSLFSTLLLGEKGEAAVIQYDDRVRAALDFSNDGGKLSAALKAIRPQGGKARLNDALERAIVMLSQRPPAERRVIIAFSDGSDHGSETQRDEVVRRATNAGTAIYGLRFNPAEALLKQKPQGGPYSPLDANVTRPLPPGVVPTPTTSTAVYDTPVPAVPIVLATGQVVRSTVASTLLEFYAGYTGGVFHSHWSESALQDQLNNIASEIQSQYEIAYVPDSINQPGFHRIEVKVDRTGVKVRARAGYFVGAVENGPAPSTKR